MSNFISNCLLLTLDKYPLLGVTWPYNKIESSVSVSPRGGFCWLKVWKAHSHFTNFGSTWPWTWIWEKFHCCASLIDLYSHTKFHQPCSIHVRKTDYMLLISPNNHILCHVTEPRGRNRKFRLRWAFGVSQELMIWKHPSASVDLTLSEPIDLAWCHISRTSDPSELDLDFRGKIIIVHQ